jgi:hypothetical protein
MMRKMLLFVLAFLFLPGCGAKEVFETLGPVLHQPDQPAAMATLQLALPPSAALQTVAATDKLYECDGFSLILQTIPAGDFRGTVRTLSGYDPSVLTLIKSGSDICRRFDWVWTSMGENGELICRAAVLDDGNYHYCVTAIAPAASGGALTSQWNALFASLSLE